MKIYKTTYTQDSSKTLFNSEYQQNYHSIVGANKEALEKFIYPSEIIKYKNPKLLDIGFGLGYNAFHAYNLVENIQISSLEKDKNLFPMLFEIHKNTEFEGIATSINVDKYCSENNKSLRVILGDARASVQHLNKIQEKFSHIFLDAFSPSVNAELWSVSFFKNLYSILLEDGALVTYSSALPVISALLKSGFYVYFTPNIGRTRGGLIAFKKKSLIYQELGSKDKFLLKNSVQSIPNIDKGQWKHNQIMLYRNRLKELSVRLGFLESSKGALKHWWRVEHG